MKRNKMKDLITWYKKKNHLPLILLGARQVGKTYLLKEFAENRYDEWIYINFEKDSEMRDLFEKDLKPERIISDMELLLMKKIDPSKTLIIMDEVQLVMKAITALKYFEESEIDYHIVCAGSLLGVSLNKSDYSFPVGKVELHELYPFTFDEFLQGTDRELYLQAIEQSFQNDLPLLSGVHDKLMEFYRHYLYVGGMPAAINAYKDNALNIVDFKRDVQKNIVNAYMADMSKYTTASEVLKVQAIYNTIPEQLAADNKKFKYSLVKKGAKASHFSTSIEWLLMSRVTLVCNLVNRGEVPIKAYSDSKYFKLYFSDVGLLMNMSKMPYKAIFHGENNLFKGAITENYVAQHLKANGHDLYYYKDSSHEVDFLIQKDNQVVPIEVKASSNKRSRSLKAYIEKYQPREVIRISSNNFGCSSGIKSVPLYAVYLI